jgi:ribosomal protein S18 acetylase RimI-like enzyme
MIRPATEADLAVLAVLEAELFGLDAWDEVALRTELDGPGRRFVVAGGDEAIGYAVSRSIGDVVDLQRIGVSPSRQRAGVATALLDDLLANPGDADRMMLEVSAANGAALAFYLRHGFVVIADRPRYYRDGSDALVLSRALVAGTRGSGRMGT